MKIYPLDVSLQSFSAFMPLTFQQSPPFRGGRNRSEALEELVSTPKVGSPLLYPSPSVAAKHLTGKRKYSLIISQCRKHSTTLVSIFRRVLYSFIQVFEMLQNPQMKQKLESDSYVSAGRISQLGSDRCCIRWLKTGSTPNWTLKMSIGKPYPQLHQNVEISIHLLNEEVMVIQQFWWSYKLSNPQSKRNSKLTYSVSRSALPSSFV